MFTTLPFTSILGPRRNFRDSIDPEKLAELEASILEHGVLQNLIVTPDAPGSRVYRVVAGERRWTAVSNLRQRWIGGELDATDGPDETNEAAGLSSLRLIWDSIPVLILEGDAAERAEEAQLVENLQREEISPLTEARGLEYMLKEKHYTLERLAGAIGKTKAHVSARLKLLEAPKLLQEALAAGKVGATIVAMVARVPHEKDRKEITKRVLGEGMRDDTPLTSKAEVADLIRRDYQVDLKEATWDFTEDFHPGGSCEACPFRSGNNPELAEELSDSSGTAGEAGKRGVSPRLCLKPACFRERAAVVWSRDQRQAEDSGVKVLPADVALRIFSGPGGSVPGDCAWADLADKPGSRELGHFDESKVATWDELLRGIEIAVAIARHPRTNRTHRLVDRAAAVAAVNLACDAAGTVSPFAHSAMADRETAKMDAKRVRARAQAMKSVSREALQAVCDGAELLVDEEEALNFTKALITAVLGADGGALGMFGFWLGAEPGKVSELVADLDTPETALGFLTVACVANEVRVRGLEAPGLRLVCDALSIDLDEMIDRAEASAEEACQEFETAEERAARQLREIKASRETEAERQEREKKERERAV